MKKISMKVLVSYLLGEVIVLLSCLFLTEDNNLFWIAVGIMAIVVIFTFYKCAYFGLNKFVEWSKERDNSNFAIFQELKSYQEDQQKSLFEKLESINDSYISSNESIKQNIESVAAMQETVLDSNKDTLLRISDLVQQMQEDNKKVCEDLTIVFDKNTEEMSKKHANDLTNMADSLSRAIDTLTLKYNQALEEMSQKQQLQLDEWKDGMAEILDKSNSEITTLLNEVEKKILENSDLSRTGIETNLNDTYSAINEIVSESKRILSEQYSNVNDLYVKLGQETKECSHAVMEQMNNTSNDNASKMKQSLEDILEKVMERLVEENEQTGQKRTEAFKNNMQELNNTYDELIGTHIKTLEKQIVECIEHFVDENKDALSSNNKLANELISSEKSFVSEIKQHNGELKDTISNAIEEYSKAVGQNILDMRDILISSISDNTQSTNDEIVKISNKNSETIELLAEKMRVYSDSLVEKSAIAIAAVQADNNTKLQEVCEQVTKYISKNAGFIEYCKELNNSLRDKIAHLIDDRNIFVKEMREIVDNQLVGMDDQMKERIEDLVEKIQNLNIENVEAYNKTMVDYREKLVEANAKAISEVQADNLNTITDANEKVSQLAKNLKIFQGNIAGTLDILESIIKDGIDNKQEQDENFELSMNDLVDEKLSEYDKKLQQYNDTFNSLGEKITEVINACQINTANYEKTLGYIIDVQKKANSLNSKDVDLLKSLMKR